MKIAVIGTGAMGSIYAARFAKAGHDVTAVDTWVDHIDAISQHGLRVDGPDGQILAKMTVATSAKDLPPQDLYVIATKGSGVAASAIAIAPDLPQTAMVVTIQNGLGAGERLAAALPEKQIYLGVAEGFGASMKGPGHATHTAMKQIRIGHIHGGASRQLSLLADIWSQAGFHATAYEDIEQLIWEKFLCNVTLSGPCTIFGCDVAQLRANPQWWQIALGCMHEAWELGKARHVAFSFVDPVAYVTAFAERVGTAKPSMLQDHELGRKSEIDAINGAVSRLGEQAGMATPYNSTLTAILQQRESRF